jgi:predicted deacylase
MQARRRRVRALTSAQQLVWRTGSCLLPAHDLAGLQARVAALACCPGARLEELGRIGEWPLVALHLASDRARASALRVLVTAGVHGVEPAGPAAALLFASRTLAEMGRLAGVAVSVVPLVNPFGYRRQVRGNAAGVDLNRSFSDDPAAPLEVQLLRRLLRRDAFDLGVDLHSSRSAGERGFFALHRNASEVLRPAMRRFAERYPVLTEGTDRYELEDVGVLRSCNQGTVKDYLGACGTRWAVTIEAPAVWPYDAQVIGSADVIEVLIEACRESLPKAA